MIKVRHIKTGKVEEVTRNIAHGLIESGQYELVRVGYKTTSMQPEQTKKYKIK